MFVRRLSNCARCQEDHWDMSFKKFANPVDPGVGVVWEYWALCPVNGEPIMMRKSDDS